MKRDGFHRYTIAEYLNYDCKSDLRNEFEDGNVLVPVDASLHHGIIGNNINSEINNLLKNRDSSCISINGDVKVYIEKAASFVYPDGMVVCGGIETSEQDEHSVINPTLLIEVLSKSTERCDRGDKFHKYCSLDSFCEYVLINQYKPVVDTLFRVDNSYWKMVTTIGLDASIYLHSIDAHIKMKDIYRNIDNLDHPPFQLDS